VVDYVVCVFSHKIEFMSFSCRLFEDKWIPKRNSVVLPFLLYRQFLSGKVCLSSHIMIDTLSSSPCVTGAHTVIGWMIGILGQREKSETRVERAHDSRELNWAKNAVTSDSLFHWRIRMERAQRKYPDNSSCTLVSL
jgi:hypothetical protein